MRAELRNNIIGNPFIELSGVDSTNNYAMRAVQNGLATHGASYFAYEQTKGKGQRDKQWQSARGENIILSIILDASAFIISRQFDLSVAAALSALDLFNKYTTNEASIKWPNDIYVDARKAAGILIENLIRGDQWQFAIVGFGININQTIFDDALKNPVSLKQITGEHYDVVMLAKELCSILQTRFEQLMNEGSGKLLVEYNDALYRKDQITKFKAGPRIFSATVKRVDEQGKLILHSAFEECFNFGDIEWLSG